MMPLEDNLPTTARAIYDTIKDLPIVSPHGHCDPEWWAEDAPFPDPAALLVVPDHYVFRMLYSQGVALEDLGVGQPQGSYDPRRVFQILADHWHCFLGTPSREWLEYTLRETLGIETSLLPETAMQVYDQISERLEDPAFRPRALFEKFNIELLATTDAATDDLRHHQVIRDSGWSGRIVPTFRPDGLLNAARADFATSVDALRGLVDSDLSSLTAYLDAIHERRTFFKSLGATATDHDVPHLMTEPLSSAAADALYQKAITTGLTGEEARQFYGHMLVEMAAMSIDDGLVMQIHAGSARNTNAAIFEAFGPDKGADIPTTMSWLTGLDGLLSRHGNDPRLRVLMFTLDESTYAREMAPMAGHWPSLRIGPPWWFHDSSNGIRRYLDEVVETAGYFNLTGFNDDTRAFLSIPARHNTWRRVVAEHLAEQVDSGRFGMSDAEMLAQQMTRDLALDAYRLNEDDA